MLDKLSTNYIFIWSEVIYAFLSGSMWDVYLPSGFCGWIKHLSLSLWCSEAAFLCSALEFPAQSLPSKASSEAVLEGQEFENMIMQRLCVTPSWAAKEICKNTGLCETRMQHWLSPRALSLCIYIRFYSVQKEETIQGCRGWNVLCFIICLLFSSWCTVGLLGLYLPNTRRSPPDGDVFLLESLKVNLEWPLT